MNIFLSPVVLLLVSILPLLLAIVLAVVSTIGSKTNPIRRITIFLAPLAALPALLLSIMLAPGITLEVPWLLFGSHFGFDETAKVFLFFTSLLWLVAGVYSAAYFSNEKEKPRFLIYFLLAMAGNFGLILAQDLLIFYTFFALMSFSAYGLVVHDRSVEAIRAARIYIILVVIGEVILFAGFTLAALSAGSTEFEQVRAALASAELKNSVIALVFIGFGIKAGVIGLHVWLPLAHPVAPTPASAVLSGAMIAAGLLGWLRVFPLGEATLPFWGNLMLVAGMLAVFYAVLVGVFQSNAKTVLAYSSISKMGLMTMAIGLGFLAPDNWPLILTAILIFALHHGLAKGALFLGVGLIVGRKASVVSRYLLFAGLSLAALALAGAPWTSGMIAKVMLKLPVSLMASPWADWLLFLLPLSSVAASILMLRFLFIIWQQHKAVSTADTKPALMWLSWCVLLLAVLLNPWLLQLLGVKDIGAEHNIWSGSSLINAFWPIVVGFFVAFGVWFANRRRWFSASLTIPAGDVLHLVENRIAFLLAFFSTTGRQTLPKWQSLLFSYCSRIRKQQNWLLMVANGEQYLRQWVLAITLFLLLAMSLAFFAMAVNVGFSFS